MKQFVPKLKDSKVCVKNIHIEKLAISKKSTFFDLSSWNLVKIITIWGYHFHQVSWRLGKKCGFFTNGQFLNVGPFFCLRLYINDMKGSFNLGWEHLGHTDLKNKGLFYKNSNKMRNKGMHYKLISVFIRCFGWCDIR